MRPIVILLLVFMHSFTMFTGGTWTLPEGIHEVPAYYWMTKTSFSFILESFVFISGYLLCFQLLQKEYIFSLFVVKKVKRLIIPSIFFSILYFCLFIEYKSISHFLFSVLNGCGHMWYLPMIFWCFTIGFVLFKVKISSWFKLLICIVLCCLSGFLKFLPLQLNTTCYYLLFFYIGMFMFEKKEVIIKKISTQNLVYLVICYIVSFVGLTLLTRYILGLELTTLYLKVIRMIVLPMLKSIYSALGLLSFYLIVSKILSKHPDFFSPSWLVWLNSISFGVYIYQQFILKLLYYHTSLPQITGTYLLPWIGLIVTVVLSLLLSTVTNKTKFGRFLIG